MKKYITVLSVLSCLAVVYLHVNDCFWHFSYGGYWILANIIESIFYFAVPVFFMISGCTLIDYRSKYDTKVYFLKRIHKTVIPFIIWSMLALLYRIFVKNESYILAGVGGDPIRNIFGMFFNSKILGIYWFFLPLFSIYLCIPALSFIPEANREKIFRYLLIAAFFVNIAFPFIFELLKISYNEKRYLEIFMVGSYLFYPLAGYYIDKYPIKKSFRYVIYALGLFGLALHMGGTFLLSYQSGGLDETFKGYLNVPCVMYSVSIFILFKYGDGSKIMDKLYQIARFFVDSCFGVYLIHWFVMDLFLMLTGVDYKNEIYRLVGGIGFFVICALLTKLVQKIPILKRIVP